MSEIPDNVVQLFPSEPKLPKPVPAQTVLDRMPADVLPFFTGKPRNDKPNMPEPEEVRHINKFITFEGIEPLDVKVLERPEIYEASAKLDKYLIALAESVGEKPTAKLAKVIEALAMEIADLAFAEGLSEGFLIGDEENPDI